MNGSFRFIKIYSLLENNQFFFQFYLYNLEINVFLTDVLLSLSIYSTLSVQQINNFFLSQEKYFELFSVISELYTIIPNICREIIFVLPVAY